MASTPSARAVVAFAHGEIKPECAGLADDQRTRHACRTLRNMTVGVYGSVTRRAGLQFIASQGEAPPPPPIDSDPLLWQSQVAHELVLPDMNVQVFL